MAKKKELTPMEKLTAGYNNFIKGKTAKNDGVFLFERAIKKTVKKKK